MSETLSCRAKFLTNFCFNDVFNLTKLRRLEIKLPEVCCPSFLNFPMAREDHEEFDVHLVYLSVA